VESPEGVFQIAGGGLLEATEAEVGHVPGRVEDPRVVDAGHFDALAAD